MRTAFHRCIIGDGGAERDGEQRGTGRARVAASATWKGPVGAGWAARGRREGGGRRRRRIDASGELGRGGRQAYMETEGECVIEFYNCRFAPQFSNSFFFSPAFDRPLQVALNYSFINKFHKQCLFPCTHGAAGSVFSKFKYRGSSYALKITDNSATLARKLWNQVKCSPAIIRDISNLNICFCLPLPL
jgi:hypothetical protein